MKSWDKSLEVADTSRNNRAVIETWSPTIKEYIHHPNLDWSENSCSRSDIYLRIVYGHLSMVTYIFATVIYSFPSSEKCKRLGRNCQCLDTQFPDAQFAAAQENSEAQTAMMSSKVKRTQPSPRVKKLLGLLKMIYQAKFGIVADWLFLAYAVQLQTIWRLIVALRTNGAGSWDT